MTPELLMLNTYDRLFQRLVSTHKEIPLGIYRTSYQDNVSIMVSLCKLLSYICISFLVFWIILNKAYKCCLVV